MRTPSHSPSSTPESSHQSTWLSRAAIHAGLVLALGGCEDAKGCLGIASTKTPTVTSNSPDLVNCQNIQSVWLKSGETYKPHAVCADTQGAGGSTGGSNNNNQAGRAGSKQNSRNTDTPEPESFEATAANWKEWCPKLMGEQGGKVGELVLIANNPRLNASSFTYALPCSDGVDDNGKVILKETTDVTRDSENYVLKLRIPSRNLDFGSTVETFPRPIWTRRSEITSIPRNAKLYGVLGKTNNIPLNEVYFTGIKTLYSGNSNPTPTPSPTRTVYIPYPQPTTTSAGTCPENPITHGTWEINPATGKCCELHPSGQCLYKVVDRQGHQQHGQQGGN